MPVWIDRAGAGLCGLVTALVIVGVLANSLMAVPFGTSLFGFARVDIPPKEPTEGGADPSPPDPDAKIRELWLTPDRFAWGLTTALSNGVFSGEANLATDVPDKVEAASWVGAVPSGVSRTAAPGSISVVRTEPIQFVYREILGPSGLRRPEETTYEAISAKSGHVLRMVRVKLKKEAMDQRKNHLFTLRQFRIVGRTGPDEPYEQYHGVALQADKTDPPAPVNRHVKVRKTKWGDWHVMDNTYAPRDDNSSEVEVVFEIPAEFTPEYVEYKLGARASIPKPSAPPGEATPPASESTTSKEPAPTGESVPSVVKGGNVRRYTTRSGKSFFGDQMPLTMKSYQKQKNADVQRNAMVEGHLVGFVDEQEGGTDPVVEKFHVDPELRLLQLNTGFLQARSGLGRAISFAVETLQNYQVEDADGNRYEVVGKYAIADVEGRQVVEIQYFSNRTGTIGSLGPFNKIKSDHLKGDYEFAFLFLVKPGARIVTFSTGGDATRADDLQGENLVAPE
jgi:hypothetical protein